MLPGESAFSANGDLFPIREDDGRPAHSVRLAEDITERKHAEPGIKTFPTIVLAGLGAFAALTALGLLEHFLERVFSEAIALSVPVIFGSIAAAGITYFALKRQGALYSRTLQEITERERAENARRRAQRKYRDIFENAVEGIFQTTPDGRFITANPALAKMLGYESPDELIATLTNIEQQEYVHPERRVEFKRLLDQHDTVRDFEFEAYRRDGARVWMSDNVRAVRDAGGELLYYEGTVEDITERKRAEAALRESEERYRDLIENSRELICTHDLDGRVLSANRAAAEALGYDPEEFEGKRSIRDILAPEVRNQFDEYMARLCKDGATSGVMLVETSAGERRIWEYYNSLRTEGVAAPIVRGMAHDITERRRAEAALRESEERYRELFENARDAIYVHDLKGAYTSVNRAAERLSGYPREEIIGKHFWDFVPHEYARQIRENLCKKLEEVEETTYEVEIITRDGRRVPVEVSSRLIYEDGVAIGAQGTARDITERKRAEEARVQLASIVESSDDAIISETLGGVIVSWNSGAERIYGYSAKEVVGHPISELVPPDRPDEVRRIFKRLGRGERINHYETVRRRKDGRLIDVSLTISLIKDATGRIGGASTIARDITNRKQTEKALLTFSRRLIEAQEAERQRIARELHDQIGQGLTALKLNLHAIQYARDRREARPLIEENLRMLDEALEQVRDLSVDLRPLLLDDLGLVTALRWYVDHQAQRTGVRAEFTSDSLDPNLRFSAEVETACFRIAQEALTNVARHAQAKLVTVRLSRSDPYLILFIKDDGVGFDIEAMQKHAVASATLGLRGMEERTQAVGGRMSINSTSGKGTQVTVRLPIAKPNQTKPNLTDRKIKKP